MKWDCDAWYTKRTQWHRWFAWYPVRVGPGDCRWLETIQRKGHYHGWDMDWSWEYRECQ